MNNFEKYGITPESEICSDCDGTGRQYLGKPWTICPSCNGTGRKSGKIDPIKEAKELKKEIRQNNEQQKGSSE